MVIKTGPGMNILVIFSFKKEKDTAATALDIGLRHKRRDRLLVGVQLSTPEV